MSIQKKLDESLCLLKTISQELGSHQCHSTQYEHAYWQESQKLEHALLVNKQLSEKLHRLQNEANRRMSANVSSLISLVEERIRDRNVVHHLDSQENTPVDSKELTKTTLRVRAREFAKEILRQ
jgi:hypothetical protein